MDHVGQGEQGSGMMSLCDSLSAPDLLSQNLNLTTTNSLSLKEDRDGAGLLTGPSVNNNGQREQQEGRTGGAEDLEEQGGALGGDEEEEDTDALMKEEDESEASSFIHCQSPGTPMTDSSYSDTGSLLETPFSPGTSPEPTFPMSPEELSRCDGDFTETRLSVTTASTSDAHNPSERSGRTPTPQPLTSSVVCSHSPAEPGTVLEPSSAATAPSTASTAGPIAAPPSDMDRPCFYPTSQASSLELLDSLDRLAQDGDDTQLPQRLHQIAEAFVLRGDYQQALCCIHLEQLYHQRVLENLHTLQEHWERRCRGASSSMETKHLEALQELCQTHSRPRLTHTLHPQMESLRPKPEEGDGAPSCPPANQRPGDSSSWTSHAVTEDLQINEGGRGGSRGERGEVEDAISVWGDILPPSTAGEVDQSEPAKLKGGDSGQAEEMEEEAEEAEEEEEEERRVEVVRDEVVVETLVSRTEEEEEVEEIQGCPESQQDDQNQPPSQLGQLQDQQEEEEEEEYELELADVIRGAATLDDLAKLITVEELSPASGLVSILKRRSVCEENVCAHPEPEKPPPKRRVRFKVSDDGYESEVGGGDSCLLLFLLCLVTVVISVGGTALYCALGDPHSSVCQDFSRNLDFYVVQSQRVVSQIQHWFVSGSS